MKMRLEFIEKIAKMKGWNVAIDSKAAEFFKVSPAGEDFSFSVSNNNVCLEVSKYADSFDVEEHTAMWLQAKQENVSGVPALEILLEDSKKIKEMLCDLADTMNIVDRILSEISSLRDFIEDEVPFRLIEMLDYPEDEFSKDDMTAIGDYLYDNSEIMFNYDKLDDFLSNEELLKKIIS